MFTFLLVVHAVIAAALVGVILIQRSEGGGLGMGGGSPSGLMSARGAADFLTRSTSVLGALFVIMSIVIAGAASLRAKPTTIDTSLARPAPAAGEAAPAPVEAPASNGAVPLAQ